MQFIECGSISINYNIMGIANINYNIVTNDKEPNISDVLTLGGQVFEGIVTSIIKTPMPNSELDSEGPWYNVKVSLISA